MIARVVSFSARRAWLVIVAALALAVAGAVARGALRRDAIPDLSSPQIVLVADWMGHPADDVASRVTEVLTAALEGVDRSTSVRGTSMSGMAYVDVAFDDAADLEAGRRAIVERAALLRARLPADVRLQIGPVASSTGWVFEYVLVDPRRRQSAVALRHLQDDVLRPALAAVPGVAEVASVGGAAQEVLVELDAERLRQHAVAFTDVADTLRASLADPAIRPTNLAEFEALPLPSPGEAPGGALHVRDVGHVHVAEAMPTGVADYRGVQPAVGGIVVARRDADLGRLVDGVKAALDERRDALPPGVEIATAYDRSDLVARADQTLQRALGEEVATVVAVTLVFLLDGRSALVPLLTLPVVLLLAFGAMWLLGVPATIMSLGGIGIALGMAVDADVVALEACHRSLESMRGEEGGERRARLVAAAGAFAPALLTALVITALTFLPVFAFTGESGRLLRPLAASKTLVVAAAALVTLTLAPALRDRLLVGPLRGEFTNPLTRRLVAAYRPFVHLALTHPGVTLMTAALAVASCLPIAGRLGGEFLPRIDEGDLLFMPTTLPGAPDDALARELARQDRALRAFAEVAGVFGKIGRADTATDPAPYTMAETVVRLRPRSEWPPIPRARWYSAWAPAALRSVLRVVWPDAAPLTAPELVDRLERAVKSPGWVDAWTAPARARMDMMSTGVRTPVGVRVVAAGADRLDALGPALRGALLRVPGTRSAVFESMGGEPWLDFALDAAALGRFGVDPALARATVDLVVTGGQLGEIALEPARERLRVRIAPDIRGGAMDHHDADATPPGAPASLLRGPIDVLREVTVRPSSGGSPVPLALLGRARYAIRPAALHAERGERVAYLYVDLDEGTDVSGYVERARREVDRAIRAGEVRLEAGERVEWTGQYELLAGGLRRLRWIVPVVALSMLGLLYLQLRSLVEALIVLASVPFALVGSCWTLYLLGYPVSAPVWVGLLSTVGLAMQTGVIMVVYIDEAFHRRVRAGALASRDDIVEAHAEGTVRRLRPKIMTITTMAASLLPLLWADGAGAEVMRRVAAPMLGGLATSAMLTLEVLPVVYTMWRAAQLRRAQRLNVPLRSIVGDGPGWARGA